MSKRKNVDEAFQRIFRYEWGESPRLNPDDCGDFERELIRILGSSRAGRVIVRGSKRRLVSIKSGNIFAPSKQPLPMLKFSSEQLHEVPNIPAKTVAVETKNEATTTPAIVPAYNPKSGIDKVLAQLSEPNKTSTVKKTSDDWESFKQSDKQLQDELEKQAQSKDALLVRQDFLSRVDNRKFEIEKEGRERERARRGMNN